MLRQRDRIQRILTETIITLCNNGLDFSVELCVEGLLGITLDHHDILLVNIKEVVSLKNQTDTSALAVAIPDAVPDASSVTEVEVDEASDVRDENQNEEPEDKSMNETVVDVERIPVDIDICNESVDNFTHAMDQLEAPRNKVARYDDSIIQQVECSTVARNDVQTCARQAPAVTSTPSALVKEEPVPTNIIHPEPQEQMTASHSSGVMCTGRSLTLPHDRHTNSTTQGKTPTKQSHKAPVVAPVSQPPVAMHQPPATFFDSDLTTQLQHAPIMSRLLMGTQGAGLDVMSQGHVSGGTMSANNASNDIFDYMTGGAFGTAGLALHAETQLSTVSSHNAIREVKLFSCPQCSFTSKRKFNVERHVLRLHYVRCDKCHQFFRSELDLKSYHLPHCHQDSNTAAATSAVLADMSSLTDAHQSTAMTHPAEHAGKSRSSEHAGISFPLEAVSIAHLAEVIGASRLNSAVHHSSEPKSTVQSLEHSGKAKSSEHVGKLKSHQVEQADVLRPTENPGGVHTAKDTRSSPMTEHNMTSHMAEHKGISHMAEHTGMSHLAEHKGMSHMAEHKGMSHMAEHTGMSHLAEHKGMPHMAEHTGMSHMAEHKGMSHMAEHTGMSHMAEHTGMSHMAEHTVPSHMGEHAVPSHVAEHTVTSHMAEHASLHHPVVDHGPTPTAPEHMNLHMPHHVAEHAGIALAAAEHMVNAHMSHQTSEHSGMTPTVTQPMINMHMSHQTSEHSDLNHSGLFYHLTDRVSHT